MIEIGIALAAASVGAVSLAFSLRRRAQADRDERAQVIAMGEGMGIEYVPGEDFDAFRAAVVVARDRRAWIADVRWQEAERVRFRQGKVVRVHEEERPS